MEPEISRKYGQKVRLRACGLCWADDKLLMVNHQGLYQHDFWTPPGGGVDFGEPASDTIVREFREEVGLSVKVSNYLFGCEFIKFPFHAVELFFEVHYVSGILKIGSDPETTTQIIKDVRWMSPQEIRALAPTQRHGIFNVCENPAQLTSMQGFWSI